MKCEFFERDRDNGGKTIYWFKLTGTDRGTGWEFDGQDFGIVEESGCDELRVLDGDGCPMTDGDWETIAVLNHVTITDEMRGKE
jgi:hypothetical protein